MREYLMSAEECDEFGLTFFAENDEAAIEDLKEVIPQLVGWGKVWNLHLVERTENPELHLYTDADGWYHQIFVKQGILDDVDTGLITLAG